MSNAIEAILNKHESDISSLQRQVNILTDWIKKVEKSQRQQLREEQE